MATSDGRPYGFPADARMAMEMHDASPEGQRAQQARLDWINSLPEAALTFYPDGTSHLDVVAIDDLCALPETTD